MIYKLRFIKFLCNNDCLFDVINIQKQAGVKFVDYIQIQHPQLLMIGVFNYNDFGPSNRWLRLDRDWYKEYKKIQMFI